MSAAGLRVGINYGLNRVRFVRPMPSGARLRGSFTLLALEEIEGGARATRRVTVGREGSDKPCRAVGWLVRCYE